ncbi:MAG: hypothetical protein Kow0083_11030 [Methylophaga sp.]
MAEKTTQEQSADQESPSRKGLSVSLLIKIAVGLGVLLIAMIVSFFLLSQSADIETEAAQETLLNQPETEPAIETELTDSEAETGSENNEVIPDLSATQPSGSIEAPAVDTGAVGDPNAAITAPNTVSLDTPEAESTASLLAEIVVLQQQVAHLQEENQKLIRQIEQLSKENQSAPSKPAENNTSAINTVPEEIINDDRLVNIDDVPAYHVRRHANTSQPRLAPKWGEFDEYNSDS